MLMIKGKEQKTLTRAFIRVYALDSVLKVIEGAKYYAYILHDQDSDMDDKLKKAHYHIVVEWPSSKRVSTLEQIEPNINIRLWERGAVNYLTHKNDKNKYQYSLSSIVSNANIDTLFDIERQESKEKEDNTPTAIKYITGEISFGELLRLAPKLIYSMANIQRAKEIFQKDIFTNNEDYTGEKVVGGVEPQAQPLP